jgi:hypothetical protein
MSGLAQELCAELRKAVQNLSFFGRGGPKFLALTPECCLLRHS